jgi:alpha-beta hydrolase superfamily lysophospholipase
MPLDATLTPLLWEPPTEPRALVVMLHGLTMAPEALLPFAQTLDAAKRQARLNAGPSDLHDKHPAGRPQARAALASQLNALTARWPQLPLVLLGYSQGGMLACDHTLLGTGPRPDALVLLSSTRIAFDEWQPVLASANSPVRGLPVSRTRTWACVPA